MRTLILALATSATIFANGVIPVGASGGIACNDFAGAGDCGFTSYQQCQASGSGRSLLCGQSLSHESRRPDNSCQAASSLTPLASRANQVAWSACAFERAKSIRCRSQVRYCVTEVDAGNPGSWPIPTSRARYRKPSPPGWIWRGA